jgi:twinkle protein
MQDSITERWRNKEICEQGRSFLAKRHISIPDAIRKGVCTHDGNVYFMYHRNGEVVRWKGRSIEDKKIMWWGNLPNREKERGFKTPFFSQFKAPSCDYLIITEGEFDCIALHQLRAFKEESDKPYIPPFNCVSLPGGAASVASSFENNYDFLQQFKCIYIAFDMDEPGEVAAKKAISLISPFKARRIVFPNGCKDANDWVKEYDPTFHDLEILMENAKKFDDPCITDMHDLPLEFYKSIDLGISSGFEPLDNLLGGLRIGEVTVISADTGAGKSTFCLNLMKNIAEKKCPIWLNSYEMAPEMTNRKLASCILQKQMKYRDFTPEEIQDFRTWTSKNKCYINGANSKVDLEILRNLFEKASLIYGVKYILLDHLDYIYANGKKRSALENIDDTMRELHTLAMQFKVGVFLVVHPKQIKANEAITMSDLKGSSSIKQYADNVIIITRMERLNPYEKSRIQVRLWKNRLVGTEGTFFLKYVAEKDSYETI